MIKDDYNLPFGLSGLFLMEFIMIKKITSIFVCTSVLCACGAISMNKYHNDAVSNGAGFGGFVGEQMGRAFIGGDGGIRGSVGGYVGRSIGENVGGSLAGRISDQCYHDLQATKGQFAILAGSGLDPRMALKTGKKTGCLLI